MIEQALRRARLEWAARDLQGMRNIYAARAERGASARELADLQQMIDETERRYSLLLQVMGSAPVEAR